MKIYTIKTIHQFLFLTISLIMISLLFLGCGKSGEKDESKRFLKFSGGPSGGTFQFFSNGMAVYLSKKIPALKVSNQASQGSTENLRKVDNGRVDFAIVYSGDVFLARNGKLAGDTKKYRNIRTLAFLYRAPAQLAVLKKSRLQNVNELQGKRVDIGGPGSGAAASAERYFKTIGLWDKINRSTLGYNKAAQAMKDGHIDAMWILAGYPTSALINLSSSRDILLLDLYKLGVKSGLQKKHPYYKQLSIPSGIYKNVNRATDSFFDSALWVAGAKVSEEIVYTALKEIFSAAGLKYMVSVKKTARQMSIRAGITGIVTPLHKGAQKFWGEKGLKINEKLQGD